MSTFLWGLVFRVYRVQGKSELSEEHCSASGALKLESGLCVRASDCQGCGLMPRKTQALHLKPKSAVFSVVLRSGTWGCAGFRLSISLFRSSTSHILKS